MKYGRFTNMPREDVIAYLHGRGFAVQAFDNETTDELRYAAHDVFDHIGRARRTGQPMSALQWPFKRSSRIWYMIESSWWECNTSNDCGHCDACTGEENRQKMERENPELYRAIWALVDAYDKVRNLLKKGGDQ
jgi:hypothetical protein